MSVMNLVNNVKLIGKAVVATASAKSDDIALAAVAVLVLIVIIGGIINIFKGRA